MLDNFLFSDYSLGYENSGKFSDECINSCLLKIGSSEPYEFDSQAEPILYVRGRLSKQVSEWEKIGAPGFILSVIREGYKIPFVSLPPSKIFANNSSAIQEMFFVSDAIKELLHNRCVEPLKFVPEIVNPLSVSVQSSGKKRLILDLRRINMYVFKQKFKCEDLKELCSSSKREKVDTDAILRVQQLRGFITHPMVHRAP